MKKVIIGIVLVAVIGIGAFFVLKNKETKDVAPVATEQIKQEVAPAAEQPKEVVKEESKAEVGTIEVKK